MSAIETMLGTPLAQAIGWALVHLVWQGIVVAGILAALLALLQRQSAHARYVVSCAAMLVLLTMGAVTAYRAYDAGGDALIVPSRATTASVNDAAPSLGGDTPTLLGRTRAALPKIVLFWIVGVAALSFRLAGGWLRAQRLAKRNASPAAAEWQQTVARLSDALGLRRGVELLHSAAVEVPTVLGWLRPVILLPMTLSGLSPEQIEMILAHELAHIRRHDFLVNLMQSFVETLLFYHPAVWWISARIRIEREHCCDDAAVAIGGNALQYARALTRLEELRGDTTQLALAANGGSLIERIRRVAGIRGEGPSRWVAGAALLTVVAVLFVAPSLPLLARDQATPPAPPAAPAAPPAIASTPAAPAPPAVAQSRIEVRADASDDDGDDDVDVPEPPEVPDPPEQPAPPATPRARPPHAPRTPRAPRASTLVCPESIDVHVAPMVMRKMSIAPMTMPKIAIPPMDIHIDGHAIADGVRQGVEMQKMSREMARRMATMSREMARHGLVPDKKYKEALRGAGLTATEREAEQLHMMGVTPRYVQSLRDAGLKKLTAHDVIRLHSMGITAGFVKELRRMQQ
ncbi:MAG TPA: M56 family metallopeptidase [Thermoanaerobaculia bacterium]|nr:M56 family metallopeptidase [Thermoanaerobaculia bacterium]